jgi:hypothetical protein
MSENLSDFFPAGSIDSPSSNQERRSLIQAYDKLEGVDFKNEAESEKDVFTFNLPEKHKSVVNHVSIVFNGNLKMKKLYS